MASMSGPVSLHDVKTRGRFSRFLRPCPAPAGIEGVKSSAQGRGDGFGEGKGQPDARHAPAGGQQEGHGEDQEETPQQGGDMGRRARSTEVKYMDRMMLNPAKSAPVK